MSNQLQEIYSLLAEWAKKWTFWWWVSHVVCIAAMVVIVALTSYYCNYIYGVAEDKSVILCWLVLLLVISVIYLFCLWREDKESFKWLMIVIIAVIIVLGAWDAYHCECFVGKDRPITLHYLVGFLLTTATIYFIWRRTVNQEEQTKSQQEQIKNQEKQIANQDKQIKIQTQQMDIQINKEVDDRFTTAVNLLGSSEASARIGAIYSLYQQAVEDKKYRKQIVQILCSHIRSKTQEPDYQKDHKYRPSNEIQTTIDLLFRERENDGLYFQFGQELPKADLSYAYCVGADFELAHCQRVDFFRAYCQGADFGESHCQGATFGETHCQESCFWRANCQGTYFTRTYCQGADFGLASCQGTIFSQAHFQGADFDRAYCQGANFWKVYCQGANFEGASCQGAYSSEYLKSLENKIGKNTELEQAMIVEGALSEKSIDAIEKAKEYCSSDWYSKMQKIIEYNKDKEEKRGIPDGINSEILKDSNELQKIIKLLKEIEEKKQFFNRR